MPNGRDLGKLIVSRIIAWFETPREERRKRKESGERWMYRWFGLLPFSFRMWTQKNRRFFKQKPRH